MIRKYAFTLSETLITLAIIGIVAAMTTPALINKFKERVTVTKLKKFYNVLSQSYLYAVQEYGEVSTWGIGYDKDNTQEDESFKPENALLLRNRLFVNAKIEKTCDNAKDLSECGITKIYYLNGKEDDGANTLSCALVLADGSNVFLHAKCGENCGRGNGALNSVYSLVYFDTNGYKKPNTAGKDIFVFIITGINVLPEGSIDETAQAFPKNCSVTGRGCTAWVIFNENMDYLHCTDLSWGVKTKCN